jgi:hypothetical protein
MAVSAINAGGSTNFEAGCKVNSTDTSGFAAAVALAQAADIVILALGIDLTIEGESHDRISIDLPEIQHQLAAAITAVGKPTVLYILNGGCIDIGPEFSSPAIGAILSAGYAGFLGGQVIAQTLFGENDHLGGKLSTTWYTKDYVASIAMSEMEVDVGPGRGYRYFTGTPLFSFGYGLALTTFTVQPIADFSSAAPAHLRTDGSAAASLGSYSVLVTNTGSATGDEVVQLFFYPLSTPEQPQSRLIRSLVDYKRVHLQPGQQTTVSFEGLTLETLKVAHRGSGDWLITPGIYELRASTDGGETAAATRRVVLEGPEVLLERFPGAAAAAAAAFVA